MVVARRSVLAGFLAMGACGQARPAPPLDPDAPALRPVDPTSPPACQGATPPSRVFETRLRDAGLAWRGLSPDGRTFAVRRREDIAIGGLDGDVMRLLPFQGPTFGNLMGEDGSTRWSSDNGSLWLLGGEIVRPSGFTAGPVRPVRLHLDGRVEPMPELNGLGGRLDRVFWANGDGLGLAQIDTHGGFYRPELPDTRPSLAVIDARRGRVRARLSGRDVLLAPWGRSDGGMYVTTLACAETHDGRVRAIAKVWAADATLEAGGVGGILLWTEGEAPVALSPDIAPRDAVLAFTPGADRLLVSPRLSASGVIYERRPSPPPTPQSGVYAVLNDIEGGRRLWSLSGVADQIRPVYPIAVSAGGRKALIGVPESCGGYPLYGLVDLRDGQVERRFVISSGGMALPGFHGETPWLSSGSRLELFT
jgi:hypothetical protein